MSSSQSSRPQAGHRPSSGSSHGAATPDTIDAGATTLPAITFGGAPEIPDNGGSGTIVFDSLGDSLGDEWNPHDQTLAESFSTHAGITSVTDVQLLLDYFGGGNDGGAVTVDLLSDSSTSPGTLLASLGTIQDSSLPTSFGTVDLAVTGAPTLTADTRYWIEVTASTDNVNWGATDATAGTEVATEFMAVDGDVGQDGGGDNDETFLMSVTTDTACFAAGTRILTARGEVAVEALREGDRVVTARDARLAPVRWVGHRRVAPPRHPRLWDVNPVRVRADAFGAGRPGRDLILSPDHALFLDGVLVRARDLLNGATVAQESVTDVTYYHVQLDRHDVLLAEGMAAESFLDTGNRAAFANGGTAVMAHPDFARAVWARDACAQMVWEGPQLAAIRATVATQAERLGWRQVADPDLYLTIRGCRIRPCRDAASLLFNLPPGTNEVCLRSRAVVPAYVLAGSIDTRRLGVGVVSVALDGSPLPLHAEAFGAGWLAPEPGLRWTNGAATLRVGGARRLKLRVAGVTLPYWTAPETSSPACRAA